MSRRELVFVAVMTCLTVASVCIQNSDATYVSVAPLAHATTHSSAGSDPVTVATSQLSGVLPVANGGTGATSLTARAVIYGNGTSAVVQTNAPTSGQTLIANGSATPVFVTASGDVTNDSDGIFTMSATIGGVHTFSGALTLAGGVVLAATQAGSCTLSGVTAVCTSTVKSGCRPSCTYNSASVVHLVACSVTDTTLTAISATISDTGTVNWLCL